MCSYEESKLLEVARLLNEHQDERGVAAFISKNLQVSGRDVGKVKRMMNDGLIVFNDNGEPRLIVPADEFEYFLLGKATVEWAATRGVSPEGITPALIDEMVTEISEFMPRKLGRPKGSSVKPQFLILSALMDGPKSFQGIVDATGFARNTVANNLKILASMEMLIKNKNHCKIIYEIDPIRFLFFFDFIALKGNLKAKKVMRTVQKKMKPVQKLPRCMRYREIVELLSSQPELINKDPYDILYYAMILYNTKREQYCIEHGKPYLPSHPERQVSKIREASLSLGDDTNEILQQTLKTLLKSIIETEDIKS